MNKKRAYVPILLCTELTKPDGKTREVGRVTVELEVPEGEDPLTSQILADTPDTLLTTLRRHYNTPHTSLWLGDISYG